jgi:ligand-binding SRPBCC domain-containing protein
MGYTGVDMFTLIYKTHINCTQEELFDFHLDSNNITKITPPDTKVELLSEDISSYEGKIVKIKTTKFFIPTFWEVKIEKLIEPKILVDVALKSPFKYWKHQHIFIETKNGCELQDIIEYELPLGFVGKLVEPFITNDIKKMFEYRHIQTKKILEENSPRIFTSNQ